MKYIRQVGVNVGVVATVFVVGFGLMATTFSADNLTVVLNGLYGGSVAAIFVAFGPLLWQALIGEPPYDRVRQMTLAFFCIYAAYTMSVGNSFWFHATGKDISNVTSLFVAFHRFVAVLSAWLFVTAPDFGLGMFYGRDRKVLILSSVIGVGGSGLAIYMQTAEVLKAFAAYVN